MGMDWFAERKGEERGGCAGEVLKECGVQISLLRSQAISPLLSFVGDGLSPPRAKQGARLFKAEQNAPRKGDGVISEGETVALTKNLVQGQGEEIVGITKERSRIYCGRGKEKKSPAWRGEREDTLMREKKRKSSSRMCAKQPAREVVRRRVAAACHFQQQKYHA
jgi:hypothetical protein